MVMSTAWQVVEYPDGEVLGEQFALTEMELPDVADGHVLVRNTWTSVDPGLRLRLRPSAPSGYFAAFPLRRPMDGILTVGVIEQSRAEGFPVGSCVWHSYGWRSHAVVDPGKAAMNGLASLRVLDLKRAPAQAYLGPLGGMGLTAYAGLHVIDALDGAGTLWVSAAAGAVGSLVCQIAKFSGLRVVASAGTDEKVAWLRNDIGVDAAFNWRAGPLEESLRAVAPEGLDFYFDNVGGTHLEAALEAMNNNGRVSLCGSISDYEREAVGPRNLFLATSKNLTLRGFRGSAHAPLLDIMQERLAPWLADGRLAYRESIYEGLESAPAALADMMAGRTVGKTMIRI
ncbi:NADP-dependent oxidoreductase [Rhodococcus wratislaviensis]|uniref:Putative oxidoreductase n=1 Tax=Rhodococcus wratislaviensis NBRC 100605 TaxID=1219028 RepID=X0QF86_RHOWR|nr:NADP-dependent oxidoreductase [Rhodococcus wratislaviensis]GAF49536.1 putative oxidoreductase [Rhodococcus wratislaviensis NBRC 100605]